MNSSVFIFLMNITRFQKLCCSSSK